jgi:hypothetical protein
VNVTTIQTGLAKETLDQKEFGFYTVTATATTPGKQSQSFAVTFHVIPESKIIRIHLEFDTSLFYNLMGLDIYIFLYFKIFTTHLERSHIFLPDFDWGRTVGVTGRWRMLAPPRHLVLPSRLSGVPVALHSIL